MDFTELLEEQLLAQKELRELAVATIVSSDGGTTRTQGKMLIYPDGAIRGTIGGGAVEQAVIRDALQLLSCGENAVKTYDYSESTAARQGLSCGGRLSVFIESCRSTRPNLVMVGGGHVGTALMRAARLAGFAVTLIDTRDETQIGEAIPLADRFLLVPDFSEGIRVLSLPAGAFYVIATYGHTFDGDALSEVLSHPDAAYVGMIGSRKKISALFTRLEQEGISPDALQAVHSPIGLDLGGETPEEIAVSILAELLMVKNHRTGRQISGAMEKTTD